MKKYLKYLIILAFGIVFTSCSDYLYEPNIVRYEVVRYGNQYHVHYYSSRPIPPPKMPHKHPLPPPPKNSNNYGRRH